MAITKKKRKKGYVYWVRIKKFGKWITKSFDRYYDAQEFEKQVKYSGDVTFNPRMTFSQAADEWVRNHVEVRKAPSSIKSDKQMLRDNLLPAFGKKQLSDIRPEEIDLFINYLKTRNLSPSTINRNLEVIRTIFNYCKKRRKAYYNPMDAVEMLKTPQTGFQFWTEAEARQFLRHTERYYKEQGRYTVHRFFKFLLNTGLRVGEAMALGWSDVDLENGLITICRTVCSTTRNIRDTTKGGRIRHVPINDSIYGDLVEMKRSSKHELVFTILGTPFDHSNINKWFKRDVKAAGVKKIRVHDLRHSYASNFVMNGGEIYVLQAILGHSDIKTTERYAHLSKSYLRNKANTVRFTTDENIIKADFRKAGNL